MHLLFLCKSYIYFSEFYNRIFFCFQDDNQSLNMQSKCLFVSLADQLSASSYCGHNCSFEENGLIGSPAWKILLLTVENFVIPSITRFLHKHSLWFLYNDLFLFSINYA